MRLFIFLLMLGIIVTASTDQIVKNYTEPDDTYSIRQIKIGTDSYAIVTVNRAETFLINESSDSLLRDGRDIESVFISTDVTVTETYKLRVKILKEFIENYNKSRQPEENQCKIFTGTDKIACLDKDSCIKACYSSPICGKVLGSVEFALTIREWYVEVLMLDGNVSSFFQDLRPVMGTKSLDNELEKLLNIRKISLSLSDSYLVNQYAICPGTRLNYTALDSGINLVNLLKNNEVVVKASEKASVVENRTDYYINFSENKGARFKVLDNKINGATSELTDKYKRLAVNVYDADLEKKYNGIVALRDEIESLASQNLYKQAFAKEEKFDFDSALLNTSIDAGQKEYSKILVLRSNVSGKLGKIKVDSIVGYNITGIREEFGQINQTLGKRVNKSDLNGISLRLINTSSTLDQIINSGVQNETPPKSMCSLGLVLLLLLGYVYHVRK